ncbi:MAG: tetratricopeptide repeat protein [Chloroflexi bacterium]|nr:tetratricopeptide repeat protein [Chloroflexota bacterium]
MSAMPSAEKIGQAWRLLREGDSGSAIDMFNSIVAANPANVDAHYGLGLAHKALGEKAAAIAAFQQALSNTEQALEAVQTASHVEGNLGDNDLESNFDDRYMMLTRMISQRLEDLGAAT